MVKEVLYSARTGDERRFICCEWWCEGYWLSLGELNQCVGESSRPTNLNHLDIAALPEPPKATVKEASGDVLVVGGGLAGLSTAA